ncbi:MAG: hypothetical protein JWO84_459 [Parcubacteria group bacterium]|nr:hypothetical protein [Parcubacteria group bacterium]
MAGMLMRTGQILFVLGFVYYFFSHHVLLTALIAGLGFIIFILGAALWSLETGGDVNFS